MTRYKWATYCVGGYSPGTIGYDDGHTLEVALEKKLEEIEQSGEEIFAVNITSSTRAYIVSRWLPRSKEL